MHCIGETIVGNNNIINMSLFAIRVENSKASAIKMDRQETGCTYDHNMSRNNEKEPRIKKSVKLITKAAAGVVYSGNTLVSINVVALHLT